MKIYFTKQNTTMTY